MIRRRLSRTVTLLVVAAAALTAGCEVEWIKQVAYENLGAFVVDIVQTGVNQTINN